MTSEISVGDSTYYLSNAVPERLIWEIYESCYLSFTTVQPWLVTWVETRKDFRDYWERRTAEVRDKCVSVLKAYYSYLS